MTWVAEEALVVLMLLTLRTVLMVLAILGRQVTVLVVLLGLRAGSLGYRIGGSFVSFGPYRGRN